MQGAPDYAGPLCGWRAWLLAETEQGLLLRSVVHETLWQPRRPLRAECLNPPRCADHAAPAQACRCGIYAACAPARAIDFLDHTGRYTARPCQYVLGRVFLWGQVVECTAGWRAERAYPAHLYLPDEAAVDTARALARYQVPLEPLPAESRPQLLAALQPLTTAVDQQHA